MALRTENVLGYSIVAEGKLECGKHIVRWIQKGEERKTLVCANPHSLVQADHDPLFRNAILGSDMVIPDGAGILVAAKILGVTIQERVTGSDIFQVVNETFNRENRRRCFFLGSTKETLARLREKFASDFPNVIVAGCFSPPFRDNFTEEDDRGIIEIVNKAAPDVLWVGMTAPKQEKWIFKNRDKLNVKFVAAVGAVFDFYTGNVKRSHPWFLEHGLEWLPRLLQEPKRLWRRTFISAPLFLVMVLRQRITGRV
jgi:N-acetylglucosaminyldiphosphoundecaprenol N-acetyl-beta-D-mannosaminyltransferase